jgi:hypothetical protein
VLPYSLPASNSLCIENDLLISFWWSWRVV